MIANMRLFPSKLDTRMALRLLPGLRLNSNLVFLYRHLLVIISIDGDGIFPATPQP
jgi:hypothetical protein